MPDHIQYENDDLFNPETHHEHSDVPVRPLWWAMIIFVVFAILTHIILWFFYKALVAAENRRAEAPQTAIALPADYGVPQNQPLLQPFPKTDESGMLPYLNTPVTHLKEMRRSDAALLQGYGWVDRQNGVVRIPIDRAREILVTRLALSAAGVQKESSEQIPPATGDPAAPMSGEAPAEAPAGNEAARPPGGFQQ